MIGGSEKRNRQLAFELQNPHVCEKRSKNFYRIRPVRKVVLGSISHAQEKRHLSS